MADMLVKAKRLTWRQWVLLAEVSVVMGATWLLLRLLPFKKLQALYAGASEAETPAETPVADAERIVWAARVVARRMLGSKPCLTQALTVQWFLRREGIPSALRIGVMKADGGQLKAHAWLESGGRIIIGGVSSPARYATLQLVGVED